jgi:hypothetical protein
MNAIRLKSLVGVRGFEPPAPASRSERPPAKPLMFRQGASVYWTFVHGMARDSRFGQVQRTRGNYLAARGLDALPPPPVTP